MIIDQECDMNIFIMGNIYPKIMCPNLHTKPPCSIVHMNDFNGVESTLWIVVYASYKEDDWYKVNIYLHKHVLTCLCMLVAIFEMIDKIKKNMKNV